MYFENVLRGFILRLGPGDFGISAAPRMPIVIALSGCRGAADPLQWKGGEAAPVEDDLPGLRRG